MAEASLPIRPTIDTYLGEFRRGPAIFTVHLAAKDPETYRVFCDDGAGPGEVCTFDDRPGSGPKWRGAWQNDKWCEWIESEARQVIRHPNGD